MSVDLKRLVALAESAEQRATQRTTAASGQSWYRIANAASRAKTAEVFIYDTIGDWGVTAKDFVAELRGVKADSIELHINSYGGAVFDGVAIYNALINHPAHIMSIVDGIAASAASFIAMAGEEIEVEKTARMMIHDASGAVWGNAKDMREHADLLDGLSDMIAEIYADRAGNTVAHWRNLMLAETWFAAQEAVDAGLANRIAGDIPPGPSDKVEIAEQTPLAGEPAVDDWPPTWLGNTLKETLTL